MKKQVKSKSLINRSEAGMIYIVEDLSRSLNLIKRRKKERRKEKRRKKRKKKEIKSEQEREKEGRRERSNRINDTQTALLECHILIFNF